MPAGAGPGGTERFGRAPSAALEIACRLACWIPFSLDASRVPWVRGDRGPHANSDTGDRANKSSWRAESHCDGRLERSLTKAEYVTMRVPIYPEASLPRQVRRRLAARDKAEAASLAPTPAYFFKQFVPRLLVMTCRSALSVTPLWSKSYQLDPTSCMEKKYQSARSLAFTRLSSFPSPGHCGSEPRVASIEAASSL
jgi:hypothetical protein